MGFASAQTGVNGTATSGLTVTAVLGSNPATGSVVLVGILFYDGTTTAPTFTVVDNNSNSYTVDPHDSGSANMTSAGFVGQAYLVNAPANADKTIKVTFNKAISGAGCLWVNNFSVTGGTAAFSSSPTAGSGVSAITTPTITVPGSNTLLWGVASDNADVTGVTGSWVLAGGGEQFGCGSEYQLAASANTACGWTGGSAGDAYNAVGLAIAFTASGGSSFTPASLLQESGRYNLRHRQPQGREWARRDRIFIPRHLAEGKALVKAA